MDPEITEQLNEQLRQMTDLIGQQNNAMSAQLKLMQNQMNAEQKSTSAINANTTAVTNGMSRRAMAEQEASTKIKESSDTISRSLVDAAKMSKNALVGFSSAMLDSTQGISKYSSSLTGLTGAVSGVLGNFGILGKAAGGIVDILGSMVSMGAKYNDAVLSNYDLLAKSGGAIGLSGEKMMDLARSAGFTSQTLGSFTKNVVSSQSALINLGGSVEKGREQFTRFVDVGERQLQQYRRLGMSQEDLIDFQSQYMSNLEKSGSSLRKSPEMLQKASLQYLDTLNALSDLTGQSAKQQQDALDKAMANQNFQTYLTDLQAKRDATRDAAERKELDQKLANAKAMGAASEMLGPKRQQAMLEAIASEGKVMTKTIAENMNGGFNALDVVNRGMQKDASEAEAVATMLGDNAKAIRYTRDTFGEIRTSFGEASTDFNRLIGESNEARVAGVKFDELKTEEERKKWVAQYLIGLERQEIEKKQNGQILDAAAKREAAERDFRKSFDDLMAKFTPVLNDFILKIMPIITNLAQFIFPKLEAGLGWLSNWLSDPTSWNEFKTNLKSFGEAMKWLAGGLLAIKLIKGGADLLRGTMLNPMWVKVAGGLGGLGGAGGGGGLSAGRLLAGAGSLLAGGLVAGGLGYLGNKGVDYAEEKGIVGKQGGAWSKVLADAAAGAAGGATGGALFGGIGAIPGAIGGGIAGLGYGLYDNWSNLWGGDSGKQGKEESKEARSDVTKSAKQMNTASMNQESSSNAFKTSTENFSKTIISFASLISSEAKIMLGFIKTAEMFRDAVKKFDDIITTFGDTSSLTGGSGSTAGATTGGVDQKDIQKSMNFLQGRGWSRAQAAGIVGNLVTESKLKTNAVGDNGKAYGIAQWHPDRQAKFKEVTGKDIKNSTLEDQLGFLDWELRHTEKAAGNALSGATTAAQAASIFDRKYERSSGAAIQERMANANAIDSGNTAGAGGSSIADLGYRLRGEGLVISGHSLFGGQEKGKHSKNSRHYRDMAIDINAPGGINEANDPVWGPKFDSLASQLGAAGFNVLWRVPGHDNHIHASVGGAEGGVSAARGGVFSGSRGGYPATLHGTEIVAPLTASSILMKLATTPDSGGDANSTINNLTNNSSSANDTDKILAIQGQMIDVLTRKLDTVIDVLETSHDTHNKILRHTAA